MKTQKNKSFKNKSIRNFIIIIVVIAFLLFGFDRLIAYKSNLGSNIKVNSLSFYYERSSVSDLSTTLLTRTMFKFSDEEDYEKNYPLINLPTGNKYDEDTVNIVVIGDSLVWGYGTLNRNELFWPMLERNLRSKGYNCRIYPIGMMGATSFEELDWLTKTNLVEDLDPDIVMFGYVYNDWFSGERGFNPYSFAKTSPVLSVLYKIIPNIVSAFYITPTPKSIKEGENNFVAPLNEYAKEVDFPIVCMTLPEDPSTPKYFYKPLHKIFPNYSEIKFYDCYDEFVNDYASDKHADNYRVNPTDTHPGSATNKFFTDYIVNFLENDYGDIIGKSQNKDLNNREIQINEWLPRRINLNEKDRTADSATYTLDYPSEVKSYNYTINESVIDFPKYLLNYPLGKDHIKLSFATPVDVKQIEIIDDSTENIELYYTKLNEELGYDDHSVIPFSASSDNGKIWIDNSNDLVTSILIHADCKNDDGSKLTVKVKI